MAQTKDGIAEVGLGQGERSALLGPVPVEEADAVASDFSLDDNDPTQQLLLALGHFQRTMRAAQAGTDDLWSDECMNQLILGVEISLAERWSHLVDAFTDAGRVLQTYESAGRARDALPFLDGAYDVLCGIVGEVMGGAVRPQVLDKWHEHYAKALEAIEGAGLTLVDDGDGEAPSKAEGRPPAQGKVAAFEFARLDDEGGRNGERGSELPALDELPSLDSMSTPEVSGKGPDDAALETSAESQEAGETVAQSAPNQLGDSVEPSKAIVDIVDRICDELAELNDRSPENRVLAMEMIGGGIAALKREADKDSYAASSALCDSMTEACTSMTAQTDSLDERFTELCFAFCGVFVEAMDGSDSENIRDWRVECMELIEEWAPAESAPEEVAPEVVVSEAVEVASEESATTDVAPAAPVEEAPVLDEVVVEEPLPDAVIAEEPVLEPEGPVGSGDGLKEPETAAVAASASEALFEQAQRALATGDAEAAKSFALRAAAAIALAEVTTSERQLEECEERLKASLDSTVEARGSVKEAEKMVKSGASQVAAGERSLGEAKERTAGVAQELLEEEERVAEIDGEIAALQARREEGLAKVAEDNARLNEAKGNESSVAERLDGLRSAEVEARKSLEASRQDVKDLHRTASEVELRMEKAREALTKHKMSLNDIRQTIAEPAPEKVAKDEPPEELLF